MTRWALSAVMIALVAGGRLGFDGALVASDATTGGDGSSGTTGDGAHALGCSSLPPTCGPMLDRSCCESPVVPGGTFARVYDKAADAMYPNNTNPATLSTFRLDKYEITVGRFRQFVASGGGTQTNPPAAGAGAHANTPGSGWDASFSARLDADTAALVAGLKCDPSFQTWTDAPGANENRPLNCVTWFEVMAFCIWDGGYLPTDAEWNYAAAGGAAQRAYPWSNPASSLTLDDSTHASYYVDSVKQCEGDAVIGCAVTDLVTVGSKPAGDGMWGQSDLGGNVSEWLLDVWQQGFIKPCTDCAQLTPGFLRMIRGGDFYGPASFLRAGHYDSGGPDSRYNQIGARCARAP